MKNAPTALFFFDPQTNFSVHYVKLFFLRGTPDFFFAQLTFWQGLGAGGLLKILAA